MTEKPKLPQSLSWGKESNTIWLATSFLLHRNLSSYLFPHKLTQPQLMQTLERVKPPLLQSPLLKNPSFLYAPEISLLDKEFLYEHFLCLEGFQNTQEPQGFIVDETGQFFATINFQNHLQMRLIDGENSFEKAWNTLEQVETAIGKTVDFAFSPKFGFLTSDPSICGTGLIVRAYLHVPALIHMNQLQETLLKQQEEGILITSMEGSLQETPGDLLIVSNAFTLGVNEENILRTVHSMAMKLMAIEKQLRSHLQTAKDVTMKDLVCRAFGLLLHSYQIQTKEALNALSLIKLGTSLDWISGITEAELNQLYFECRKGHLLHHLNQLQITDSQEIAHKRAEYLHKIMQKACLKIETSL